MADRRQLHLPRHPQLRLHRPARPRSSRCSRAGSASCARARRASCSAGTSRCRSRRRSARSWTSRRCSSSPRPPCARACTGASTWTISASSASTPTASSSASSASSACSPRPPIRARRARSRICAARSTRCVARAGFDPDGHSGKALVNVLENYPRDELFQIDEDTLYHFALAMLQLDERPRVRVLPRRDRFDRFVSVLVYVPRERYDSDVRKAIGDYLADAYNGRVSAFYPFFPEGPLVRVHFIIGLSRGPTSRRSRSRRRLERAVEAIVRTWTDELADALVRSYEPVKARAPARALSRRVLARLSRGLFAGRPRSPTSASSRACRPARPLGVDFHRRAWDQGSTRRAEGLELQPADPAVRARAGAGEHGLPGGRRAHLSDRPRQPTATPDVWFHDMLLERADGRAVDLDAVKHGLEAAFLVVMRGGAENDGYNALVLAAGMMWRDVALIRDDLALPAPDPRALFAGLHVGDAGQACARSPPTSCACSTRASIRVSPSRWTSARRARPTSPPRSRPRCRRSQSLDEDRILRHFVNAVQAAIRTNFYQIDADGQAEAAHRHQVREPQARRPAAAAAALRDLRLFAAGRGRASALRQGRARRHPLVRPAAGFPHRGARPGQGAAGQERGHRAGRRQGRLRAEAAAADRRERRHARGGAGRRHRRLQAVHLDAARHHRQSRREAASFRPTTSCATTTTIPISWSPPTRAPPPSPTSPTRSRRSTASGSATPSPPAARPATTTRRWASPRAAPGNRSSAISARWTSISARRRSPWSASATCRATCSATACCGRRTIKLVAAFDHRDIFIDPAPDPERSFAERQRLFELPRSSWQDYDQRADLQGRRRVLALAEGDRAVAGGAGGARLRQGQGDAAGGDAARSSRRRSICCSSAASAPMCARRPRPTTRSATAPTMRSASPARELRCKVIGEGANLGMTQRGRDRGGAARRPAQHRRHRQFGRRQHLGRRGQHQDRAGDADARRQALRATARNALLAEMTDDVAALVLRNNYLQTLALSLAERRGLEDLGFQQRLMQTLETARRARPRGRVPARRHGDRRAPAALAGAHPAGARGAARLCQARRSTTSCSIRRVPDDPYLGRELGRYFPRRGRGALSRRARASPAAARDHRHPARQLDDQPRRAVAARAHRRPDRRRGPRASPPRSPPCATATA